ncbi:MAG: complex I subunit 5 family protein [Candidatus Bathyarchaeia archaeon]
MDVLVLAPIFSIIFSAIISPLIGARSKNARNAFISFVFCSALALNTHYLLQSLRGAFTYVEIGLFGVNAAGLFMLELVLILGFLGVVYSFGYIDEVLENETYYILYNLFIMTMMGMVISFNILVIYGFLEASCVIATILIMFSRRRSSIYAAYRYIALSLLGATIILIGLLWQYIITGTLNITGLTNLSSVHAITLSTIYFIGFGIKAGLLPFGFLWLPPAHSEAPIPIHALLSAVFVQVAAFSMIRVIGNIGVTNLYVSYLMLIIGIASMISGAVYSLIEAWWGSKYTRFHVGPKHICGLKRVWALSTISEVGYISIFTGLIGVLMLEHVLPLSLGGALLHIYNHGFCKAQLLFDSGVAIKATHAEDLNLMGGAGRTLPRTRLTFVIGCLGLSLIPFTLGVSTLKELVFAAEIPSFISISVMITAGLTLIACFSAWYRAYIAEPKGEIDIVWKVPKTMSSPGLVLNILTLALGSWITLNWMGIPFLADAEALSKAIRILAETVIRR